MFDSFFFFFFFLSLKFIGWNFQNGIDWREQRKSGWKDERCRRRSVGWALIYHRWWNRYCGIFNQLNQKSSIVFKQKWYRFYLIVKPSCRAFRNRNSLLQVSVNEFNDIPHMRFVEWFSRVPEYLFEVTHSNGAMNFKFISLLGAIWCGTLGFNFDDAQSNKHR